MENKNIRSAAVVIHNNKVLLIHRRKAGEEYYVFPGGRLEQNESLEQCALRELREETCIEAEVVKLLHKEETEHSLQYYYLCKFISGEPKIAKDSVEARRMKNGKDDFYKPVWTDINKLKNLLVYPEELKTLAEKNDLSK